MMNTLILGDYAYSSWSLRGWLLFDRWGLPRSQRLVTFSGSMAEQMAEFAPSRTVPTWITPDGAVVSESLAIAEELAARYPDAGIWPAEPLARATARSLAAEMHSGFVPLRHACPMNLRASYSDFRPDADVLADLARIEQIWAHARATCTPEGPWLCGAYSAADAFFAPVAARIAGYGLPVGAEAAAYVAAHLEDRAFRRWRAMGMVHGPDLPWYARDFARRPWPGPAPMPARAIVEGRPENDHCPYSGKPVTHLMETGGRIFGFCNAFCRDKTAADPGAWPAFMDLYDS